MPSRATSAAAAIGVVVGATLVAAPAPATAAGGDTLYVSNSSAACSDSGTGTQTQPYCNPQPALDAARPGDTVMVSSAVYGALHVRTSGTEAAPITVVSANGRGFRLPGLRGAASEPGLEFDHVHDVVVRNFAVSSSSSGTVVQVSGSSRVSLDGSSVSAGSYPDSAGVAVDGASEAVTVSRSQVTATGSAFLVAAGAQDTVLAGNRVRFDGGRPGIQADAAPGTVVVSNTLSTSLCGTGLVLGGASTGAVVENNAVTGGTSCAGGTGVPAVVVSAESAADVVWDYNTIESPADWALYDWAGQHYVTPVGLHTATGRGGHDTALKVTSATTSDELQAPLIDSADANAPHEPAVDVSGNPRLDDPLVADQGTGPGWFDRGATELQDPYQMSAAASATKGPAPLTLTLRAAENNPWQTKADSYTFDFGDGTDPVVTDRPTATHTYTAKGSYSTTVRATMADGATAKSGTLIQVVDDAPLVPALWLRIPTPEDGLTVQARGNSSSSGWSIASYTFDFGDGSAPQTTTTNYLAGHTYTAPGTYTVTMTVEDDGARTATTTGHITVGSALVPIQPVRALDTRHGTGALQAKVGPAGTVRLKIAGANSIPATGVSAVTLNLTGVNATAATYVTAYPAGRTRPTASSLNLTPNRTVPNQVTVPVGDDGSVELYNFAGTVDLVADIQGYYTTKAPSNADAVHAGFVAATAPTRVLDTRTGPDAHPVGPGQYAEISLPADMARCVGAAVVNVTETQPTASGWVGIQPLQGGVPTTSVLNFTPGRTSANEVVVPIDANGRAWLYNAFGSVHLVADLQGYVVNNASVDCGPQTPYFPISPSRALDTRVGAAKARLAGGSAVTLKVAGTGGVPAGAKAVLVNLTGIAPTTGTWLAAYPHGTARPTVSNLNLDAGEIRPVLALVPVGADGSIDIHNAFGAVDVAVDIQGYYLG